ncbi:MAG: hypothetical protein GF410_01340 [Chitinivibrionales bacterium]|nr:hypothetical protein [Chitinivibrionales bacterium]
MHIGFAMTSPLPRLLAAVLLPAAALFAQIAPSDHLLLAGEHVPADIRIAGLAGAGVAVPEGIACVLQNPAMLHSYNVLNEINLTGAISSGSGETEYQRYHISAGAGVCLSRIFSVGLLYRYLKPEHEHNRNSQITLNLSGRLFDRSINRGVVNYGVNVRYEKLNWKTSDFAPIYNRRISATDTVVTDTNVWDTDGDIERRRLAADIGFFQDNIGEGLDFGLTFTDLIGYTWTRETPTIVNDDSLIITATPLDTDTVVIDSSYYGGESTQYNKWLRKHNRRVDVGLAFHKEVLEDRALMYLPFHFEIFNLFDLDTQTHLAFRTGLEVWIKDRYCLRFGYGRAPESYPADPGALENANIFSGGAGARISSFGVDLYIRRNAWGLGGSVAF